MKNLIIVLLLSLALLGCRTVRKATQSKQETNSSFVLDNIGVSTEITKVINDKDILITETTTETVFFSPDSVKTGKVSSDERSAVKSVKNTVKQTVISDKGTVTVEKKDSVKTSLEGSGVSKTEVKQTVKTKPKTNGMFVGLLLGVIVTVCCYLYFTKTNPIGKFFGLFKR